MAIIFVVVLACLLGSAVNGLPLCDGEVETQNYHYSEHRLSGASGMFRYPLSGSNYGPNERVTIYAEFPGDTLFIIEDYNIEASSTCELDKLSLHQWRGDAADESFCGRSNGPKFYRTDMTFLLTFATDSSINKSGFNLRWAPIEPLAIDTTA